MRLLFILLIFGLNIEAFGQTYLKRFNIAEVSTLAHNVLLIQDSIVILGVMADTANINGAKSFFLKVDQEGVFQEAKIVKDSSYKQFWIPLANAKSYVTPSNDILSTGYVFDTTGFYGAVYKYNQFGDTIGRIVIGSGNSLSQLHSAVTIPNSRIAFCGYRTSNNSSSNTNHYLAIADSSGQIIWQKMINHPDKQFAYSIFYENSIITSCGFHYNGALSAAEYEFQNEIYQFDLDGNEISYWQDTDIDTHTPRYIQTNDGGYISAGQKITTRIPPATARYQGCIIKWDSNFNKVWEKTYGTENGVNYLFDIEENTDGSFVACGSGGYAGGWPDTIIGGGWLLKIDPEGNLLWNRQFMGVDTMIPGPWYENQLYDLAILPDGDIVAVGYAVGPGAPEGVYQQSYLLRVNSDGCFDDGTCGSPVIVSTEDAPVALPPAAFSISPNPVWQVATLTTSDTWRGGQFQLFDGLGRVVLSGDIAPPMQQISLSGLPSGMYVLVLRDVDGKAAPAMVSKY